MRKEKENLTPTERLKSLKAKKRGLFLGEIGCAVAPLGVLSALNFKEYFIQTEAWRTSVSFAMLVGGTLVTVALITKDKLKVNLLNALIVLGVIDGFLWILGNLITQLAYILLYVILGFVGAFILELKKKGEVDEIKRLEEGILKGQTDIIADEYKAEVEKQKVKVIIKNDNNK